MFISLCEVVRVEQPPAGPDTGEPRSCRHPVRTLHLGPGRAPRRWRRLGPPGRPALEAVAVPGRARLAEAGWETAGLGAVLVVALALAVWLTGLPVGTAVWVLLGALVVVAWWRLRSSDLPPPVVAGDRWVATAPRRGARVLAAEDLARIESGPVYDHDGEPVAGTTALRLVTGDRRTLLLEVAYLRANPALWELVRHGLAAAVAAGAAVDQPADRVLRER